MSLHEAQQNLRIAACDLDSLRSEVSAFTPLPHEGEHVAYAHAVHEAWRAAKARYLAACIHYVEACKLEA